MDARGWVWCHCCPCRSISAHAIHRRTALPSEASTPGPLSSNEARRDSAERRLIDLDLELPAAPKPLGIYTESVQSGNLLFLSGMLPTQGDRALMTGRVGAELDVQQGARAAYLAALNALALVREHLGSLDRVARVVRLCVSVATFGDVRDHPVVADGASDLLQ